VSLNIDFFITETKVDSQWQGTKSQHHRET